MHLDIHQESVLTSCNFGPSTFWVSGSDCSALDSQHNVRLLEATLVISKFPEIRVS